MDLETQGGTKVRRSLMHLVEFGGHLMLDI
jgi:hypothetical protein